MNTTTAASDSVTAIARATRDQRTAWAVVLGCLALASAIAGLIGWQLSKPDELQSAASGAANSLNCLTSGIGCDAKTPGAEPLWLYVGGGVTALMLLIAVILLATRPALPRSHRSSTPAIVGQPDD